jgi:hypothetical protein
MNIIKKILKKLISIQITTIDVEYLGFDNITHVGKIQINKSIKNRTISVFRELLNKRFKISNIDISDGRSDKSIILKNDSTAYNFRTVLGEDRLSKHAFGFAIDINPKNNPAKPSEMFDIYDTTITKGVIDGNIIGIFKENGFEWGGEIFGDFWDSHHFEIEMNWYNKSLKYLWEKLK